MCLPTSEGYSDTIRIWPSRQNVTGHSGKPVQAAWMADQRHAISIDDGAEVRIWDTSVLAGVDG